MSTNCVTRHGREGSGVTGAAAVATQSRASDNCATALVA